jgi:hypothetical protein
MFRWMWNVFLFESPGSFSIEECRAMLRDALHEMVLAYQMQKQEIPLGNGYVQDKSWTPEI